MHIDHVYVTPCETHNPIEMHSSVATWNGERLTMYETCQGVVNQRLVMAQVLGIPVENVRVITKFLGSGFGGKFSVASRGDGGGGVEADRAGR